jgi:hypothetical protein
MDDLTLAAGPDYMKLLVGALGSLRDEKVAYVATNNPTKKGELI